MYVQKARMEVIHSVPSAKSESEDEFVRNFQTCKKVFGELGENPSRGPVSDAPRLSLSIIYDIRIAVGRGFDELVTRRRVFGGCTTQSKVQ
jgi:hypothetical protein